MKIQNAFRVGLVGTLGVGLGLLVINSVDTLQTIITYIGAAFLAVIAVIPTLVTSTMDVDYNVASFYGGTGLLIVISVALDLVQKINSHLVMRNYPGLTED